MSAWQAQPEILRTRAETARLLKSEGDRRVWTYRFEAFSWAHPHIDVHARMADELEKFLPDKVLP